MSAEAAKVVVGAALAATVAVVATARAIAGANILPAAPPSAVAAPIPLVVACTLPTTHVRHITSNSDNITHLQSLVILIRVRGLEYSVLRLDLGELGLNGILWLHRLVLGILHLECG